MDDSHANFDVTDEMLQVYSWGPARARAQARARSNGDSLERSLANENGPLQVPQLI